jgi:glycosyltransferase involved in cell wall biosynthesis
MTTEDGAAPALSVVVPVYNEAVGLREFNTRLDHVLQGMNVRFEIIYVNDGSSDESGTILNSLNEENSNVSFIQLSRNFGKEIALTAGLDYCNGNIIIIIDSDLQDPPELIPDLYRAFKETRADIVYARRASRAGESFLKKSTARMFYRVINRLSGVYIPVDTGDFRLMSRRSVDALLKLREHHRYMKGLFAWIGYRQVAVEYARDMRYAGDSKFNYWKLWNLSLEGITSFSLAPLKIASYFGILISISAVLYGAGIFIGTLIWGNPVAGYPSLLVVVLFLGGVQLTTLGIIGEYLGRVFNEVKQRPLYFVERHGVARVGIPKPPPDHG